MKKIILFLFLIISTLGINAQTYVLIPDANFASYLQGLIPTAMSGNSLDISSPLVTTSTTMINVYNKSISNVSGVQYFSSLTDLDCSYNFLNNLPVLPNSIQNLSCGLNSLTSLPALPNLLQTLDCGSNALTSLPALPNSLTVLKCYNNSLTSIPTLPNSLWFLSCSGNSLTSLPTLPNSLQILYCPYNNITCFSTFPPNILAPSFYNNQWNYYIQLNNNPFTCLPNYLPTMSPSLLAVPLCTIANSNGCFVGIKELKPSIIQLKIYPNPNNGTFKITIDSEITNGELILINTFGQKVFEQKVIQGENGIIVSALATGLYNCILLTDKQQICFSKLSIE